jgi:hypothetical protein
MTISNEIKAKVFACYLGQKVRFYDADYNQGDDHVLDTIQRSGCGNTNMREFDFISSDIYLVLRPLSAITDEDAIEVALRMNFHNDEAAHYGKNFVKRAFNDLTRVGFEFHPMSCVLSYQFLQSHRGYDLPMWILGGKTLKEAGLAVYE